MLTVLGAAAILVLLALILFASPRFVVALTLVPVVAGLLGGFAGQNRHVRDGRIRSVAPTAALLAFAVVYFGVMNDAGLFEPFIRRIVRLVGSDPLKVVIRNRGRRVNRAPRWRRGEHVHGHRPGDAADLRRPAA